MSKKIITAICFAGVLLLSACSANKQSENTKPSYNSYSSGTTNSTEKTQKESVSADVSVDLEDNPGITIDEAFEYNGTAYYMDMPVTRFITDSDNNIIEPPLSDDSDIVRYLYSLDEYEHIGSGGDFGVISGCELYFIEDGLILAVFPYGDHLNGDADKNDILSLYNENNIYGARFYLGG